MTPETLAYFVQKGQTLTVGANQPVRLDQGPLAWLVLEGALDVFAMRLEGGQPAAPRRHLWRCGQGQAVFGLGPEQCREVTMVAVGMPGTKLLGLARPGLFGGGEDLAAAALIDDWVAGLQAGCAPEPPPRQATLLETGARLELAAATEVMAGRALVWARLAEGGGRLLGQALGPLPAPLAPGVWLALDGPAVARGLSTSRMAEEYPGLEPLDAFHGLALARLAELEERERSARRERMRHDQQQSAATMNQAFGRLGRVLQGAADEAFGVAAGDPLLAACRVVADHLGVSLRAPGEPLRGLEPAEALNRLARASRVRLRPVSLSGRWWERDSGAFIAFAQDDGRPLAVVPLSPKRHKLFDPTNRRSVIVDEAEAKAMGPTALSMYRPFPLKELTWWSAFKFGARGLSGDAWMVFGVGVCGGLLGLISPIATGLVFDSIIPSAERFQLAQMTVALMVVAVVTTMLHVTRGLALLRVEGRMDSEVQSALWDRLLALPAPFFRGYTAGDLANRANGVSAMRRILSDTILNSVLTGVFSLFSFFLLFYYDWALAFIVSGVVLLAIVITAVLGWWELKYQRPMTDLEGRISGLVLQLIGGVDKLRVAGVEERAFDSWTALFAEQKELAYKARQIRNILATFNAGLPILGTGLVFYWMVFHGHRLSTGDYMAFSSAFGGFLSAMLSMTTSFMSVLQIIPLYNRAKPILRAMPEFDDKTSDPGPLRGAVEISRLSFRYDPEGPLILNDVSVVIEPGQFVALVGPSGSGKSTLARMLLGFEQPTSGAVYYDGQDLADLDKQAVRRQIGVVLQNGRLTPGDILSNIVGASNLGEDEAWQAAKMAGLDADIKAMPMGMHTVISEGSGTLSGGQAQRLLIARAIVKKPRIVLLDEATSALDNQTQAVVTSSLEGLRATRIVIAHRLSTVQRADRIVVIDAGKVVESGSFDELMGRQGLFYQLAKRQLA